MNEPIITRYPDMEQGTDEWLEARRDCMCTGSEFAAAMGLDHYKSRGMLLREKMGTLARAPVNEHMLWGTRMEPLVADAYEKVSGVKLETFGFVTCEMPWRTTTIKLGVSPDRVWANGEVLVEIKCSRRLRTVVEPRHLPQMLAQAVFMNVNRVHYVCYSPEDPTALHIAEISFDRKLWTKHALPALKDFAVMYTRKITPIVNSGKKRALREGFEKLVTVKEPQFT